VFVSYVRAIAHRAFKLTNDRFRRPSNAEPLGADALRRVVPLDLAAMVARGLRDKPLVQLPHLCCAYDSRNFGIIRHTGHTGPAWVWLTQEGRPKEDPRAGSAAQR
jgi:hypothetical protein